MENTAKEHEAKQQELHSQLEQAQDEVARQSGELTVRQNELVRLQQDNETLKAQLEQANLALSSVRTESSQRAGELDRLRRELDEARTKIAALEPDAMTYAAIKERTAGVELEAHRRAQAIQNEAEEQARSLRRQMEQWMQRVEREYDNLRVQVESAVTHAADQLARAGRSLDQVNTLMSEQNTALEAMEEAYAATNPEKVAAPMPIPEE